MLLCGLAGNVDALFLLGMIKFYCQRDSRSGACLLVRAAEEGHVGALHALAAINAHGSGGSAADANPAVAAEVLWHAAVRGSRSALQELGHSYLDGYGVRKNVALGVKLLLLATSSASPSFLASSPPSVSPQQHVDTSSHAVFPGRPTSRPLESPRVALEETLNSLSGSLQEMVYEHEARARAEAGGVHFSSEEVGFNRGAPAATAAQPGQSVGGAMGGWFCDAQVSSAVVGAGVTELLAIHGESVHDAAPADASSDFGDSGDLRESGACVTDQALPTAAAVAEAGLNSLTKASIFIIPRLIPHQHFHRPPWHCRSRTAWLTQQEWNHHKQQPSPVVTAKQ
ncbi:unnamed protein product [Closterium sp. Naga37s-1]|nr:unnamed protein product [Closterium sp. Naga37s-1]